MSYNEFCNAMAEQINAEAIKRADSTITAQQVEKMPEARTAYAATVAMAQVAAGLTQ